ncbi:MULTISPECIES: YccF domain-containing protein [unclassified Corallococcus]|uniref:YccF domain-containing protein n=1 Tax=Corallococcus TaxID=83461 RepID=UPI001CBAFB2D|nr:MULTISPECIES: YccF domain-containing protein [unclassified Corallococcus]MBZ4333476.1 YccF domain-containing protein [Corallococcus sp. AS-1-12]MBZ4371852.1 YccF domain-containing protein [Corallococcus sp. AS-1-6]
MNLLLNLLWIIFGGGLVLCLEYLLGGLLLCLTLVGIPFGVQCFKMAGLALMPFGKDIEDLPSAGAMSFGLNVVWALFAGIWIFLTNVVIGVSLALTIIGIPFALQHLKLGMVAFAPFGKRIRG